MQTVSLLVFSVSSSLPLAASQTFTVPVRVSLLVDASRGRPG
jgi:hypothetical protein